MNEMYMHILRAVVALSKGATATRIRDRLQERAAHHISEAEIIAHCETLIALGYLIAGATPTLRPRTCYILTYEGSQAVVKGEFPSSHGLDGSGEPAAAGT